MIRGRRYEHGRAASLLLVGTTLVSATIASEASQLGMGTAQLDTYTSTSGTYSLRVEPHDRSGGTGATYRFTDNGKEMWVVERPYTLRAVTVTENGFAVGIAYRNVPVETEQGCGEVEGFLHVIVLDKHGAEVLNDVSTRRYSFYSQSHEVPYIEQLVVDSSNDLLIVRAVVWDQESPMYLGSRWWTYQLSTGEQIARFDPKDHLSDADVLWWVVDARPVTGTPLILVHWCRRGPEGGVKGAGARFVLVDSSGHPVWSLDAANDYAKVDFGRMLFGDYITRFFTKHPAILPSREPKHFDIRLFANDERATFAIARKGDSGWLVSEVARVAYEPTQGSRTLCDPPVGTLTYLGPIRLGAEASSPFKQIVDFTFGPGGRIYLWQRTADGSNRLVQVDQEQGEILANRPFGEIDDPFCLHWTDTARVAEKRFVLMKRLPRGDTGNPAYLVDLTTGQRSQLDSYPGGFANGFTRCKDGGYIVVDSMNGRFAAFTSDGCERWAYQIRHDRHYRLLGAAKDVTLTTDKKIAVLTFGAVELFDWDGNHLKTVHVTGAFGGGEFDGHPSYFHEIVADAEAGFVVSNSENPPVVFRYTSDGTLKSRWSARHSDGRTFDIRAGVRVAPDGRLWTSDGEVIVRLTNEGVVDHMLGEVPDTRSLSDIAGLTVDFEGRIYVVAKRSGCIHIFNPRGELERIDAPRPPDVVGTINDVFVAATDRGDYYVQRRSGRAYGLRDEYLRFSTTGDRLDIITFDPWLATTRFGPGWAFQPGTGYRCGFSISQSLTIVDPTTNSVIHESEKRPNGKWFSFVSSFAMAPDGSMAALCGEISDYEQNRAVDIFAANGDPVRTIELPKADKCFTGLAYDGKRVIAVEKDEVVIIDIGSNTMERWGVVPPGIVQGKWQAYVVAGGSELWLHERQFEDLALTIHRYRLP